MTDSQSVKRCVGALVIGCALAAGPGHPGSAFAADPVSALPAPGTAGVTIEFLPDGQCKVSSVGEGFRSSATYKPQGNVDGERRCAMPPVRKNLAVALTVLLPDGAPTPGKSVPALQWRQEGARWTGTARLTAWPDAILVADYRPTWLFWAPTAAAALLAVLAATAIRRRRKPRAIAAAA